MRCRNHVMNAVAAGVALFSAAALPVPALAGHGPGAIPLAFGLGGMSASYTAIMCTLLAAAVLLPDWIEQTRGPFSAFTALAHAPAGIVLAAVAAAVVAGPTIILSGLLVRPGNGVVFMVAAAAAAGALGARGRFVRWGAAVVGLIVGATLPATAPWFAPAAVALGMWVHRVGDVLTAGGAVHPLWPLVRHPRARLPLLGGGDGRAAGVLFALAGLYTSAGAVWMMTSAWA